MYHALVELLSDLEVRFLTGFLAAHDNYLIFEADWVKRVESAGTERKSVGF